jgi:hypothetical protein
MLVVKLPETEEEFIDDKLTDIELKFLTGTYDAPTSMYFITNYWLIFLTFFILKKSQVNTLRCLGIPQLSSSNTLARMQADGQRKMRRNSLLGIVATRRRNPTMPTA